MSSWIDRALESAEIRRVFAALLAAGSAMHSRPGSLPALAADPAVPTYWEVRPGPGGGQQVHPLPACSSPAALAAGLAEFWQERGQPELAALAPDFAALAEHLKGSGQATTELPHLVYTLF